MNDRILARNIAGYDPVASVSTDNQTWKGYVSCSGWDLMISGAKDLTIVIRRKHQLPETIGKTPGFTCPHISANIHLHSKDIDDLISILQSIKAKIVECDLHERVFENTRLITQHMNELQQLRDKDTSE